MDSKVINGTIKNIEVMRATEEWQRSGAYSVRIEGMNRQYNISLRDEFDEHDGQGTKYIVLLDDGYPVATCRFFEADHECAGPKGAESVYSDYPNLVMLGRMVVLPEYRGEGLGARTMREAESWIRELGYDHIGVDSRVTAVEFYDKLGYRVVDPKVVTSGPFECICMIKELKDSE